MNPIKQYIEELCEALTNSQKRDAKKDYKFSQLDKPGIPTFSQFWEMYKDTFDRQYDQWPEWAVEEFCDDNDCTEDDIESDPELKEQFLEMLMDDFERDSKSTYYAVLNQIESSEECWRVVTLDRKIDPIRHTQLGIYWALDSESAEAHWGRARGIEVRYHAKINHDAIDWMMTLAAQADLTTGEEENEIRFLQNAKIFVLGADIDGVYHEINDWRRC